VRKRIPRGFTLIELVVVVAVIVIMTTIAFDVLRRSRPRATFVSTAAELQSLIHAARQEALADGLDVAVLVFPQYQTGANARGRVVVVRNDSDPAQSLFVAGAPFSFDDYDPASPRATANGKLLGTFDLPSGVEVGPAAGMGAAGLPFPYDNIQTDTDCSFCAAGGDRRGAIVFDGRGRTVFYSAAATTSGSDGGASLTIFGTELLPAGGGLGTRATFIVTKPQGVVRSFHNG
jgi:prepilin-type N-terminal cleavage/methylation domain-containing protein